MKTFFNSVVFLFLARQGILAQVKPIQKEPRVDVSFSLPRDSFSIQEDIPVTIILTNNTKETQLVWFDRPKLTTGGPAWTTVYIVKENSTDKILKYNNKAILESQVYTEKQLEKYLYHLKPGEKLSGTFSLYNLVVVDKINSRLQKGIYRMHIAYSNNLSASHSFIVY